MADLAAVAEAAAVLEAANESVVGVCLEHGAASDAAAGAARGVCPRWRAPGVHPAGLHTCSTQHPPHMRINGVLRTTTDAGLK